MPVIPHFDLAEEPANGDANVVSVSGEIHVSTAPKFSKRLTEIIESGKTRLVLDLTAVEFIDSTGLSVLLNGLRAVDQRGGRMALVCTNPTVLRLFQITSLDATFDIFDDRAAAVAHVTGVDQRAGGSSEGAP
ncbi:MAG TPA: STAS domain-containing protein [Solirubrobacteraceae bacterium]|nr:STAS domain-containing protein [Solirubrobacteraceae bacterium]